MINGTTESLEQYLFKIISAEADSNSLVWLTDVQEKCRQQNSISRLFFAFSNASRFFPTSPLHLSTHQLATADQLRKGFQPSKWNLLQTVRVYLLLQLFTEDKDEWLQRLQQLFEASDLNEQVALYSALPVLPFPETLVQQAREGLRTNITSVFDAIALDNPYPAEYLNQEAWNQMVLKAVFMQRPLYRIYNADERANPRLAAMLADFAHERWAAGREVMPELWRFVGPFLNEELFTDIKKVLKQGHELEVEAGLLACAASSFDAAKMIYTASGMKKGNIPRQEKWKQIGEKYLQRNLN